MLELRMAQGRVVYLRGNLAFETPGPEIEDGWVWLIVPATEVYSGSEICCLSPLIDYSLADVSESVKLGADLTDLTTEDLLKPRRFVLTEWT